MLPILLGCRIVSSLPGGLVVAVVLLHLLLILDNPEELSFKLFDCLWCAALAHVKEQFEKPCLVILLFQVE